MKQYRYWKRRSCLHCGKDFTYSAHRVDRRYCSRSCGSKASYNRAKTGEPGRVWGHDKNTFETAMELYWNGEESSAIARRLNIPVGTIYSWVHDFGSQRPRKMPLKQMLYEANSAEAWLSALRENTANNTFDDMPIRLVCGTVQGFSVQRFTSIIYESLNKDPMNGNVYAFCNKTRTTITTFAWKPPVFNIAKNIKMHGTFIWPGEELGKSIEVTKAEFDRLIFLHKQEIITEKMAKNLENMRV